MQIGDLTLEQLKHLLDRVQDDWVMLNNDDRKKLAFCVELAIEFKTLFTAPPQPRERVVRKRLR